MTPRLWTPAIVRPPLPVVDGALRRLRRQGIRDPRLDPILDWRMAWTKIASVATGGNGSTVTSGAIDTTASGGADVIVVFLSKYSSSVFNTTDVTDSASNTWAIAGQGFSTGDTALRCGVFYVCSPTTSATHTFTSSVASPALIAIAFTGSTGVFDTTTSSNLGGDSSRNCTLIFVLSHEPP